MARAGRDHPFQLPTTSIARGEVAGWYQTVTVHERSGTARRGSPPVAGGRER